jgi:hypothetical protein
MESDVSPYLARIEWEACQAPVKIERCAFPDSLPPGCRSLTLKRDGQYQLGADLEGKLDDLRVVRTYFEDSLAVPAGTVRCAGVDVDCGDNTEVIQLRVCQEGPYTVGGEERGAWRNFREVYRYFRRDLYEPSPGYLDPLWGTDWYLNGPRDSVFTRATRFTGTTRFVRRRDRGKPINIECPTTESTSRDHIHVATPALEFVIHAVPSGFGPGWSEQLGIEYRNDGKHPLPAEDTRRAIEEIVSFVLGRRLMRIGFTSFNAEGWPIEMESVNPLGVNIRTVCESPDNSPFPIRFNVGGAFDVESLLADLLPKYLAFRDELQLRAALWQYWSANEAPLGVNLVYYGAGLELLKTTWYRSTRTKTHGTYMDKSQFDALLADVMQRAEAVLAGETYGDRMLRRMRGAYNMGSHEQVDNFFDEIGLRLGEVEQAARKARNGPAHGGVVQTNEEVLSLTRHGIAYRVLFERTFLRLLGYDGSYLDKTTIGFPLRPLAEPASSTEACFEGEVKE